MKDNIFIIILNGKAAFVTSKNIDCLFALEMFAINVL